ncbi:MAG: GGDEF domain-containing protein [Clostridia bacterium]|nr:GGDEF domain-containing protein [Clostridia bacterium]
MLDPDGRKGYTGIVFNVSFYIAMSLLNYLKHRLVRKEAFENNIVYFISRSIEFLVLSISIVFVNVGHWVYIVLVFPITVTSLCKGRKFGSFVVGYSLVIHSGVILARILMYGFNSTIPSTEDISVWIATFAFLYLMLFLLAFLCGLIYRENRENESNNQVLLEQLGEKYKQLEAAQAEIKNQYEKLKESNIKLEDTNNKLTNSIAEFFTLQQISQAIGSILDIKELLRYVNDIILGVMGVSYCTIILYDDKRKRLKVHTTNIKDQNDLITLNDNINCPNLLNALDSGKPIIENFVDPSHYLFTQGRDINSLICVPLNTKSRKFGLVIIEQKYYNAFDDDNVRLLDIIGQQVGFAMENAELYQRMQELATIDGLTGVFNRLYFQERLQKEFKSSQEDHYALSLAIFDIDHFKRFNDTYGHLFGDKVLKTITEVIRNSLRSSDIFARYGGEEFVILFPRTGVMQAVEKVEALRLKIASTLVKDNLVEASVTVSFGIASFPEIAATEAELLRKADDALYKAKEAGRNCVKIAES